MTTITTCLMFVGTQHGKAEAAMTFYMSLFKRSKIISIERYGPGENQPEGTVKHATFSLGGQNVMAMDSAAPHHFTFTPAMSLFVDCETADEIQTLFEKLADGGSVLMALDRYPFAEKFAWVADRFGVSWQLRLGATR